MVNGQDDGLLSTANLARNGEPSSDTNSDFVAVKWMIDLVFERSKRRLNIKCRGTRLLNVILLSDRPTPKTNRTITKEVRDRSLFGLGFKSTRLRELH